MGDRQGLNMVNLGVETGRQIDCNRKCKPGPNRVSHVKKHAIARRWKLLTDRSAATFFPSATFASRQVH